MDNKKTNFFVTGGAGFVGSHLVDRLIKLGGVTVYDNLSSGKKEFIKHHFDSPGFKFIKGDLLDINKLKESIKKYDVVFHLAANPDISYGMKYTDWDLKQETIATYNVLESMRLNHISKIAFASTSAVIGRSTVFPTPETYGPPQPCSLYGANKLACEGLVSAYVDTFGFQAWIYRFANIIGSRTTHGVILDFINQLAKNPKKLTMLSDGTPQKGYMLVQDCVEAMVYLYQKTKEKINLYNLATSGQTSVNEIAKILIGAMRLRGVKIIRGQTNQGWKGDVTAVLLDNKKLLKTGWKNQYDSTQSVRRAIEDIL